MLEHRTSDRCTSHRTASGRIQIAATPNKNQTPASKLEEPVNVVLEKRRIVYCGENARFIYSKKMISVQIEELIEVDA